MAMSPAAVTIGAATLSRSRLRRAQNAATATVITSTTIDEMIAPITEIDHEVDDRDRRALLNSASDTTFASTASTAEIDSDSTIAAPTFWPNSVSIRRDTRNVPAWIWVPSRLPEPAEDVAAHPDRGRDQDEEARENGERVGDRGEREAGDEIAARGDQEREEARPDSGKVRAQQRDETRDGKARESKHCKLGGSDTFRDLDRHRQEHARLTQLPEVDPAVTHAARSGRGAGLGRGVPTAAVAAPDRGSERESQQREQHRPRTYSGYFVSEWYWNTTVVRALRDRHADEARGEHRGLDRLAVDRRPPVRRVRLLQHHPRGPRRGDRALRTGRCRASRCSSRPDPEARCTAPTSLSRRRRGRVPVERNERVAQLARPRATRDTRR